jgi:hypothetical protein
VNEWGKAIWWLATLYCRYKAQAHCKHCIILILYVRSIVKFSYSLAIFSFTYLFSSPISYFSVFYTNVTIFKEEVCDKKGDFSVLGCILLLSASQKSECFERVCH